MREGFHLQNCVADLTSNGAWILANSWLLRALDLLYVPTPVLMESQLDQLVLKPKITEARMLVTLPPDLNLPSVPFSVNIIGLLHEHLFLIEFLPSPSPGLDACSTLSWNGSSYFIWIERNNCLFKNVGRKLEELRYIIMVTVRLMLLTFRFKNNSKMVFHSHVVEDAEDI
ncbi:hypothetical protein Tco_0964434 [Tanacetum coccineum]